MTETDHARRARAEASRLWPLYGLAEDVGERDPNQYVEHLLYMGPEVVEHSDFRDESGHCERCCAALAAPCPGCPGYAFSRSVCGQHGYGDQSESWFIDCSECGEVSEDEDAALMMMRASVTIAELSYRDEVTDVVPNRFREADALMRGSGRLLLQHALQYWEQEEPFSGGLLYLAAVVEGTPRQELWDALSGRTLWALDDDLLKTQLLELERKPLRELKPKFQAQAILLRMAGWDEDAAFLEHLVVILSENWWLH